MTTLEIALRIISCLGALAAPFRFLVVVSVASVLSVSVDLLVVVAIAVSASACTVSGVPVVVPVAWLGSSPALWHQSVKRVLFQATAGGSTR